MTEHKKTKSVERIRCSICNHWLKNPKSIKRGIGPECLEQLKREIEE